MIAGLALANAAEAPERLHAALRALLEEPRFTVAARRVAAEVAALPPLAHAPAALHEQLRPARAA